MKIDITLERFKRLFDCEHAKISQRGESLFLLIGNTRNTQDDAGEWRDEFGNRRDWDYITWEVVANGNSPGELVASAEHYKKVLGMTIEEYLQLQH